MDVRLLPPTEFDSVYIYRFITLLTLCALVAVVVFASNEAPPREVYVLSVYVFLLAWRFAVEWLRLGKCAPALIDGDTLVFSAATRHRIPLKTIRSITSRHSLLTVRRYRSWSEHLAFLEITLSNGRRFHTLAESGVFEFPAARDTVRGIQAAVMAAKTDSAAAGARVIVDGSTQLER